jgi:C_GCAxxG_C_C family probable redox protein
MMTVMPNRYNRHDPQAEVLIAQIKERAENLYQTRQLLCTEAVVVTLNKALSGGLSDSQAAAIAAPFSIAMGGSGCICGALSGAVISSGLLAGADQPYSHRKRMRQNAKDLHDTFKTANGATCCRVLSRRVSHDREAHFQQCARLTADAAEMAARLILSQKPELIQSADNRFLHKRDSRIGGLMTRLIRMAGLHR